MTSSQGGGRGGRTLLTGVWGPAHADDLHYLRVFIGQVRSKIERDATDPKIIRTESGVGHRVATERPAAQSQFSNTQATCRTPKPHSPGACGRWIHCSAANAACGVFRRAMRLLSC